MFNKKYLECFDYQALKVFLVKHYLGHNIKKSARGTNVCTNKIVLIKLFIELKS